MHASEMHYSVVGDCAVGNNSIHYSTLILLKQAKCTTQ